MDQLTKFGPMQAVMEFWNKLTSSQKFITVVFVSLSVVLLGIVSVVASRPRMSVLFSGLQSDDSGAVVAKLQEKKIPYEIEGTAIKVPEKYIAETRMDLASQGLPQGGTIGFEIFDKTNLGMTEFAQRLNYQRGLQGEIIRSIDQLDGVAKSRVHLAIPERSVFIKEDKEPTASVILKLKPGRNLGSDEIGGIVHLVSSAVEGLKPNRVTVVDTSGNLLSESSDSDTGLDPRLSASQMKIKHEHERQVEKNIQSMLERVLGPNKAIVRVNAKLNLDRREIDSEIYQPVQSSDGKSTEKGVMLGQTSVQEVYGSNPGVASGPPGVAGGRLASASGRENGYQRVESTTNYEVSKTTERVVKAPGQIERLSVAVMVDGKVDASKIPAIRKAVSIASGIDSGRGDQITVESVEFDNSEAVKIEKLMASESKTAMYTSIGKTVGAVVLLFAFLFFLKSILGQIGFRSQQRITVQDVSTGGEAAVRAPQTYGPIKSAEIIPGEDPSLSMAQVPPEEVAQVLRKWIAEG